MVASVKRKAIGKKLRFEVFKRDKFCCQYCGQKAPDVVLVCDHVAPVAKGGETTLLNLITACEGCNAGKGATPLADDTALNKQRVELERLAERREQIDMMLQWSRELGGLKDYELETFGLRVSELCDPYYLNDRGRADAKKWLRIFPLSELLAALQIAVDQYIDRSNEETFKTSVALAISKVPGIARISRLPESEKALYYIRGILKNRLSHVNQWRCMEYLREAVAAGYDIEYLKEVARSVNSWTGWENRMLRLLEQAKDNAG